MFIKKALLYFHTLKYLKPRQVGYRLYRKLFPLRMSFDTQSLKPRVRQLSHTWVQTIRYPSEILKMEPLTFQMLNKTGSIKTDQDWNDSTQDSLWLYHLHYLRSLLSDISRDSKLKILTRWISQNPPVKGVGWEPYPLSLRIVNWIKWTLTQTEQPEESLTHSLYLQCLMLEKQLEFHLLGNHLFENAKALVFAGVYFDTEDSKRWLKKGLSLLFSEIEEQILDDGGHFERSPMYHCTILEGMLDLYQLCQLSKHSDLGDSLAELKLRTSHCLPKMIFWIQAMSHQDLNIAFFNDATFDMAPHPTELTHYAKALGFDTQNKKLRSVYLHDSGFIRIEHQDSVILADVGSVGPSYIPGHAHAGTLSFEMSLRGERVFVNRGISTYQANQDRLIERSTLSHNTISVNNEDSSQVWSSFRVGKRAKVFDVKNRLGETEVAFEAAHDGFLRLASKQIHARKWLSLDKRIIVEDTISGKAPSSCVSTFHLHPNWQVELQDEHLLSIRSSETRSLVSLKFLQGSRLQVIPYEYAMGFNRKIPGWCIRVTQFPRSIPYTTTLEVGW